MDLVRLQKSHRNIFKNEVVFVEAMEKAELSKMNDRDRFLYEASLKVYRDSIAIVETARNEGLREGAAIKEKYAEEKAMERVLEMAINCLKDGLSITKTAKLTGLAEDEVRKIKL